MLKRLLLIPPGGMKRIVSIVEKQAVDGSRRTLTE
jgi:hypothetical protein